jgi:hypothetical protein
MLTQDTEQHRMERAHPHAGHTRSDQRPDALLHFRGSFVGECDGQYAGRGHPPFPDQKRDPLRNDTRLARSRAARIKSGPAAWRTASCCSGLSLVQQQTRVVTGRIGSRLCPDEKWSVMSVYLLLDGFQTTMIPLTPGFLAPKRAGLLAGTGPCIYRVKPRSVPGFDQAVVAVFPFVDQETFSVFMVQEEQESCGRAFHLQDASSLHRFEIKGLRLVIERALLGFHPLCLVCHRLLLSIPSCRRNRNPFLNPRLVLAELACQYVDRLIESRKSVSAEVSAR